MPAKTVTVTFETPIKLGDEKIEKVTLREPKAGELRGIMMQALVGMEPGQLMTLLPRVTQPSLDPAVLEELPAVDFMQLSSAAVGFFFTAKEKQALGMQT